MTTHAPPSRARSLLRAAVVVAISAAAHALLAKAALRVPRTQVRAALARSAHLADRTREIVLPVDVAASRRELVERARVGRATGVLRVGEFLLEAGAIDAREQGRAFDLDEARSLWEARLERLRGASDLRAAVASVFGDLHYYGRAGRSMGDALLEGGGACEPLAHMIAAAIHDTGHADRARLRFYGGAGEGGATHIAPVLVDGAREHDLLTGGPARRTGALFAAADLVEIYARAHGLAEPVRGHRASPHEADASGAPTSTLADGYPPNDDRYPGAAPLFARRAVIDPGDALEGSMPSPQASDCVFFVRTAALDPPSLVVEGASAAFDVELRRAPPPSYVERTVAVAQAVEQELDRAGPVTRAERLMNLACMAALYDEASIDLALLSEHELARIAAEKHRRASDEGAKLLASIDWNAPEGRDVIVQLSARFVSRAWALLVLPGGSTPVLRVAEGTGLDDWARVPVLAALLVSPPTRAPAAAMFAQLPRRAQIDVMHEVFRAHDHQRPWASSYALEGVADGELARAYGVFRHLAWGLWEAARPQEEVLSSLLRGSSEAKLGRDWVAGFLEYYVGHVITLHMARGDGQSVAKGLVRWLLDHGYTDLDVYRSAIAVSRDPT